MGVEITIDWTLRMPKIRKRRKKKMYSYSEENATVAIEDD